MRKFTSLVLAAAMGAGLLAGCGGSSSTSSSAASSTSTAASVVTDTTSAAASTAGTTTTASSGDTFKIGVIGPLTGGASAYGTAVLYGAQVAANEINAAGGINGYQVEIVSADDENDAQKSVNCYNTLKDKGMQILAGTVTSNPCIAVADYTKEDNMFQITPSGSAEKCIANDNVFRTCFADPEQGTLSADYMSENKLGKKVGIIYDQSDSYSSGIHDAFVKEAKKDSLDVVSDEAFNADNKTDFSVQIQAAQDAGADILFLPFYYTEASLVLQQAKKMNYSPLFFGCDGMDGILTVDGFDKSLAEGLMLMAPFSASATDEKTQAFDTAYEKLSGGEAPNQFGADEYDTLYAIKAAAEKENVTPSMSVSDICEAMKKGMTEIQISGLTSDSITWDKSGAPTKSPRVYVIKNGEYVEESTSSDSAATSTAASTAS
ncbi:MAG: ABC transporter substrate-binding protein [Chordicoccus sp.]